MKKSFFTLLVCSFFCYSIEASDTWYGKNYAHNSSVQRCHDDYLLSHLQLKGNESILDVGCGTGAWACRLAQMLPSGHIVGIDPSSSMLNQAYSTLSTYPHITNLSLMTACAETFSLNEQFDHITALYVMHWIEKQAQALKNMYTHLKQGGHIHLILAPSKEGLPFYKALQKTLSRWNDPFKDFVNPQQAFDIETYRKLLIEAGFHIEELHYVYHNSVHSNIDALEQWIKQWLPYGKYLPEDQRDSFFKDLMQQYLIETGISSETKEPLTWGEYVLIVHATKL